MEDLVAVRLLQALPALHVRFVRVKLGKALSDGGEGWEGWRLDMEQDG